MAVSVTSKHASVLGSTPTQTRTSSSASYASGTRVLVVGHAISDNHTNGLGTGGSGWTISSSASVNTVTWTQVGSPTTINNSLGSTYRVQSIMWISSALTSTESFTITIDANNGGTSQFYYGINTVEVSGSNGTLVQSAVADDPDGSDTATFGSTPSGFQLMCGYAVCSHDDIVWNSAPTNFTLLSGSTATVEGANGCAIVTSSTNTSTGVTWGWNSALGSELVTTLILVEIAAASSGTNASATVASAATTANNAAGSTAPNAGSAASATTAYAAVPSVGGAGGSAAASASGHGVTALVSPGGTGVAAASASAHNAAASVQAQTGSAAATATAHDATGVPGVAGLAGVAAATATAYGAAGAVAPTAGAAGASSASYGPAGSVQASAGVATAATTANNATASTSATSYSDDFNRTDANDLGSNWDDISNGMGIRSNQATFGDVYGGGVLHRQRFLNAVTSDDMFTQATFTGFATGGYTDLRIMGRWSTDYSYYELRVNNSGEWYINRVIANGSEADITSGTGLSLSFPETWRLDVIDTDPVVLRVWRNGVLLAQYLDSNASRITTGKKGGIGGYTASGTGNATLDDYSHGNLDLVDNRAAATLASAAASAYDASTTNSFLDVATAEATATAHNATASVSATASVAAAATTANDVAPNLGVLWTDDFNRADLADLGGEWYDDSGTMGVVSNRASFGDQFGSGELQRHRFLGGLSHEDMYAQIDIVTLSTGGYSDARVMTRWSADNENFYELRVTNAGGWALARVVGATETDIASGSGLTLSLPETWKLETRLSGTSVELKIYRAGSLVTTVNDTAASRITSGRHGGIGGFTAGGSPAVVNIDNFETGMLDPSAEPEVATATATAHFDTSGGSISLNLISDNAIATFAYAHDATVSVPVSVTAGVAAATASAHGAVPNPGGGGVAAEATASAHNATASAQSGIGSAEATATAHNAAITVATRASADSAASTATAYNAAAVVTTYGQAVVATVTATSHNATVTVVMIYSPVADKGILRVYEAEAPARTYTTLAPDRAYDAKPPILSP